MRTHTLSMLGILGILAILVAVPLDNTTELPHLSTGMHTPYAWEDDTVETDAVALLQDDAVPPSQSVDTLVPQPGTKRPLRKVHTPMLSSQTEPPTVSVTHYKMRNRRVAQQIAQDE